jgi:hypothetical protein
MIAMMDLNLTPTKITAILTKQIARLTWHAAKPQTQQKK